MALLKANLHRESGKKYSAVITTVADAEAALLAAHGGDAVKAEKAGQYAQGAFTRTVELIGYTTKQKTNADGSKSELYILSLKGGDEIISNFPVPEGTTEVRILDLKQGDLKAVKGGYLIATKAGIDFVDFAPLRDLKALKIKAALAAEVREEAMHAAALAAI